MKHRFALATCTLWLSTACINNDPVENGPTASASTSVAPPATTQAPDTTMCGGTFPTAGGVQVTTACKNTAPVNCNISDFETGNFVVNADADWHADTWGDKVSLTGGVFSYVSEGNTRLNRELVDGALHVSGSVVDYAGFGMWFGPCFDATPFEGIQVTLSGDVGVTGSLVLQLQTDENYPKGDKGSCDYGGDDAQKWNVCKNNEFTLKGFTVGDGTTYYLPWASFVGGMPVATLSANQLRGLQFQSNCGTAPCTVDLRIHDLRFYRGHAAFTGPDAI